MPSDSHSEQNNNPDEKSAPVPIGSEMLGCLRCESPSSELSSWRTKFVYESGVLVEIIDATGSHKPPEPNYGPLTRTVFSYDANGVLQEIRHEQDVRGKP